MVVPLPFSWSSFRRPIVALAPMAGVTDASYRQLIKKVAPECLLFTEFLSSDAISYGAQKTLKMLEFDRDLERPLIVQIFGADPQKFLDACKVIEQMGADGIDINMGCPAAKIVSSCYGSALIRRPDLAADIVHRATNAVSIPVSVKTRLGWDTHETLIPFCQKLEQAGAKAFSIHGRRYHDKFTGKANWEPIYELKKAVHVPVIGNGDIASVEDAVAKIGNLDGVMVGRGTFGNPWLMAEIVEALGREGSQTRVMMHCNVPGQAPACPAGRFAPGKDEAVSARHVNVRQPVRTFSEKLPWILEHLNLSVRMKGERRGVLEMRRHLSGYVKGFDGAKELRMKLLQMDRSEDVRSCFIAHLGQDC